VSRITVGSVVVEGRVVVDGDGGGGGGGGGRIEGCRWTGVGRGVESGARLDVSVNRFSKVRFISPRSDGDDSAGETCAREPI